MKEDKTKIYIYTRVSTAMQIDGYSLEAQKTRMRGYCAFNEYEIAGGKLLINEAEAEGVRKVFDVYINTTLGPSGVAKYLACHGIKKIPRQNGDNELFSQYAVRLIINNPVYVGKIAFGRRKTETVCLLSRLKDAKQHVEIEVSPEK